MKYTSRQCQNQSPDSGLMSSCPVLLSLYEAVFTEMMSKFILFICSCHDGGEMVGDASTSVTIINLELALHAQMQSQEEYRTWAWGLLPAWWLWPDD